MLSAFTQAFRTPDLRAKLLFTLGIMALFRLGSILPAPGVNLANAKYCIGEAGKDQNLLSLVNVFSGGALLQLSVFALGIMPYITASIIIQLLRVVIPRFEELHKEGRRAPPSSPSTPATSPSAWGSSSPAPSWPRPPAAASSPAAPTRSFPAARSSRCCSWSSP